MVISNRYLGSPAPAPCADPSESEIRHEGFEPQRRQGAKNSFLFNNKALRDLSVFAFRFNISQMKFQVGVALWAVLIIGAASPQQAIQEGDRLLKQGKVEAALRAYDEAKQSNPAKLEPYLKSAQALLQDKRPRDAGVELSGAVRIAPSSAVQARELAAAVADAGNVRLASAILEAWLQRGDLDASGWWLLSDYYLLEKKFDQALAAVGEYEKLEGQSEDSNLRRARVLLEKGDLEESMTAFEEVTRLDPQSADAYHGLSKVCLFGNNPEAALKMSEKAVELDPKSGIYLYQLGVVLKALGRTEDAIKRLEEAKHEGADAFGLAFDMGDAYRKAGMMQKARETLALYQTLLEKKRRDQESVQFQAQGDEQLQKGDVAGARETFLRLLPIDPENWDAHNRLAKIAISSNRFDEALTHVNRMLEVDPRSAEAQFLAALCWSAKRDRDRALQHAEESERLRPGNAPLRNLLGNLYFAAGDWKRSKKEYQAASRLEPDNAVYRANLESAMRRAGK